MELKDLIFLGACALLAPEVNRYGFAEAEDNISRALELSKKVWEKVVEDKSF